MYFNQTYFVENNYITNISINFGHHSTNAEKPKNRIIGLGVINYMNRKTASDSGIDDSHKENYWFLHRLHTQRQVLILASKTLTRINALLWHQIHINRQLQTLTLST
jgi:hypothetical protein